MSTIMESDLPAFLDQGEPARLIPVAADSSKEQRATSVVLAALMSVEEFGKNMLEMVGASVSKRSKITCFTEAVFKSTLADEQKFRPDGLIIIRSGSKIWSAIVEAKIGNAQLEQEQIEGYLRLAKSKDVNAVITISNQFSALPTHHPVQIRSRKGCSGVSLYHWSWTSIISEAILLAEHKGISDPDQAYILRELIRFLDHPSSKIADFSRMGAEWKDLCLAVQNNAPISKTSSFVVESVKDWHQLSRYISLKLSLEVGTNVSEIINQNHKKDADRRLQDSISKLVNDKTLEAHFQIPNAASKLKIVADVGRRTITASMELKAPKDKSRSTALSNWAIRQVIKCADESLLIRAAYPNRTEAKVASLAQLRQDQKLILYPSNALLPNSFEFIRVLDLMANFRGPSKFVENAVRIAPDFYREVGQNLKAWVAKAPQISATNDNVSTSSEIGEGEKLPPSAPAITSSPDIDKIEEGSL